MTAPIMPDPALEPTIGVDRAAAILGVGRRTAYDAVHSGEIPSIKVRGAIRIPTARFLAKYGFMATAA